MKTKKVLKDIDGLIKIMQTLSLTLGGILAYMITKSYNLHTLLLLSFALLSDISGTTMLNMIIDRDIDRVMERTRHRPLASGKLDPSIVLLMSLLLVSAGILVSFSINTATGIASVLGFLIDIAIYTILLKRRTWLSPLMGGIAGAMPFVGGWFAGGGNVFGALAWIVSISFWSCAHIWALSAHFSNDYTEANIPTLFTSLPSHFNKVASFSIFLATVVLVPLLGSLALLLLLPSIAYTYNIFLRRYFLAFKSATMWLIVLFIIMTILSIS